MLSPGPLPLQQLRGLDNTSPQSRKHLSQFHRGDEYRNVVLNLRCKDLARLVECMDRVPVGDPNPGCPAFQDVLHELREICGFKIALPKSYGHRGTIDGLLVHIKRVKVHHKADPQKVNESFYQLAVSWKRLERRSIVCLVAVTADPLQIISGWVSNGNLTGYVVNYPDADRITLLSEGLNFLHSCDMIHGDLKGNVLVGAGGRARITNPVLAIVTRNLGLTRSASAEHGHNARWIAPEILDDQGEYSKGGDIFSFAMVTIEAFTGAIPFSDKSPQEAVSAIVGGERPSRPTHPDLTDGLWVLTQRCWDQAADGRPQALQISCGFDMPAWKRLVNRPVMIERRIDLIKVIFADRNELEAVKRLCGGDAQAFVDVLDETLDSLAPWLWKRCLSTLCKICGRQALLPSGGFADVWMGEYQGRKVAVKVLRVYSTSNLNKIVNRFCKEVMTWRTLQHPNVLLLLGVTMGSHRFAMVSEWMVNGNINEFIKAHRDANRFKLLSEVVRGLMYIHDRGMVHGDLKGANILIDNDGHARIADFGLLIIVSDPTNPITSSSATDAGTTRWMSPELLDPDQFGLGDGHPTKQSDCYALGMVIYEVLSGQVPFAEYRALTVMRKVLDGERPGRPKGDEGSLFTDDLWGTLELCWSSQPESRPPIDTIHGRLGGIPRSSSPGADHASAETDETDFATRDPCPATEQGGDQSSIVAQRHPRNITHPIIIVGGGRTTDAYRERHCTVENPTPATGAEPIVQPEGSPSHPRSIDLAQGPSFDGPSSLSSPTLPIPATSSHALNGSCQPDNPKVTKDTNGSPPETPRSAPDTPDGPRSGGVSNLGPIQEHVLDGASSRGSVVGLEARSAAKFQRNRQSLNLSPTDRNPSGENTVPPDRADTLNGDGTAMSEGEIPDSGSGETSTGEKVFGRFPDPRGLLPQERGGNGKDIVPASVSLASTKYSFVEGPTQFIGGNLDETRLIDRLRFPGNAFGKSSDSPSRHSSGYTSVGSSILVCIDGSEPSRPTDSEGDGTRGRGEELGLTSSGLRRSGDGKPLAPKRNVRETGSSQDAPDNARGFPAGRPIKPKKEGKVEILFRYWTSGGEVPEPLVPAPLGGGSGLVRGCGALGQIETPDFDGWLKKKGNYIMWGKGYCELKGRDFYWMCNDSSMGVKIKGRVDVSGYRIAPDVDMNPGSYGFKMEHANGKTHMIYSAIQSDIQRWIKSLMKSTVELDYSKPVMLTRDVTTISLVIAQAELPRLRPPSPSACATARRVTGRPHPGELSSGEAGGLMYGVENVRLYPSPFMKLRNSIWPTAPPRPGMDEQSPLTDSAVYHAVGEGLIDWANGHLPLNLQSTNLCDCHGLNLMRITGSIKGISASPPVLDSLFPPGPNDDNTDGFSNLFAFLLSIDVYLGTVSINNIRLGRVDKTVQLLKVLKTRGSVRVVSRAQAHGQYIGIYILQLLIEIWSSDDVSPHSTNISYHLSYCSCHSLQPFLLVVVTDCLPLTIVLFLLVSCLTGFPAIHLIFPSTSSKH